MRVRFNYITHEPFSSFPDFGGNRGPATLAPGRPTPGNRLHRENGEQAADERFRPSDECRHRALVNRRLRKSRPQSKRRVLAPAGRKPPSTLDIFQRRRQNADVHSGCRNCRLAASQSTNCSWPELTRFSVSANSCKCHAGESYVCSFRLKSSHKASRAISLSARDILLERQRDHGWKCSVVAVYLQDTTL